MPASAGAQDSPYPNLSTVLRIPCGAWPSRLCGGGLHHGAGVQAGQVVFLPSVALALHWELQYNCCTDLSELEMTLTHIKQDLSKGIQMSLTHWVKQVLKWCRNLLCGFRPPQCCNFF